MITINLNKAKEIHKERIRTSRSDALQKLDVDYMRAQEAGTDTSAIVAEKQVLRDLPASVDDCEDLDTVKAVWHEKLGDSPYAG